MIRGWLPLHWSVRFEATAERDAYSGRKTIAFYGHCHLLSIPRYDTRGGSDDSSNVILSLVRTTIIINCSDSSDCFRIETKMTLDLDEGDYFIELSS